MIEEHEEIPWSMLVDRDRRGRSRTLYGVAAVLITLVVAVTAVRWFNAHRHGEAVADNTPVRIGPVTTAPPTTRVPSEAELRAVDDAAASLAAVARAEWFVTDYFTVDGAPPPELLAAFATDAVLPDLPHHEGEGPVSFVEWARAYRVTPHRGGLVVSVLFRTLYRDDTGTYRRSSLRAAEVVVLIDGDNTAIGALPRTVEPPVEHGIAGWEGGPVTVVDDPAGIGFPMVLPTGGDS